MKHPVLKNANLALRFLLELCALGAMGYWGARAGTTSALKLGLAIGIPLLAAIYWGSFVSPKARFGGSRARRLLLGLGVLLPAAIAIGIVGNTAVGWTFGALAVLNTALTYMFGPQPGETSAA